MRALALALLLASATAAAGDIEYPTPMAALEALRAKPGVTFREENDWIVAHDAAANTFWSITTDAHPAHPTAVKRELIEKDGSIFMDMSVLCGASKDVCDATVRQFEQADADIAERMQRK